MVDYFIGMVKEAREQEIILDIGTMGIALQVAQSHNFEKNNPKFDSILKSLELEMQK